MGQEIEVVPSDDVKLFKDGLPEPTEGNRKLTVTTMSTVQPAILMKMGVFVPDRKKGTLAQPLDASEALSHLTFASKEGYTDIQITGPRLNLNIDFKVWVGIIYAFSKTPEALTGNTIRIRFSDFAKMCEFPNKRWDSKLRGYIKESLTRIRGKTLTFAKKNNSKVYVTGLLKSSEFDFENDLITLEADPRLWELYCDDNVTLLRKQPLRALPRKESAQALYTFIASLPENPIPLTFKRMRERLVLQSSVSEQNRTIKNALNDLEKIGYLKFEQVKDKQGNTAIKILKRNPHLKPE